MRVKSITNSGFTRLADVYKEAQWWDEQTSALYNRIIQNPDQLQMPLIQMIQQDPENAAALLQQEVTRGLGEDTQADWQALADQLLSDAEQVGGASLSPYSEDMQETPSSFLESPTDWVTEQGQGIVDQIRNVFSSRKPRRKQAQSYGEAPTMAMPAPNIDEMQSVDPYADTSMGAVPDSGNMLELFNMVKGALPADFLVEEMIRLLPPDEALTILEAIAEDNQVMPPKEVDPDSFGF